MTGSRKLEPYVGVHREATVLSISLTTFFYLLAIAVAASMVWAYIVDQSLPRPSSSVPSPSPLCHSKQCADAGTGRLTTNPEADRVNS